VILKSDDPSILDVIWLKGEVNKMKSKKDYSLDELEKIISDLVKKTAGVKQ
jgi:hypothetical protein